MSLVLSVVMRQMWLWRRTEIPRQLLAPQLLIRVSQPPKMRQWSCASMTLTRHMCGKIHHRDSTWAKRKAGKR